ncbi:MAG: T9SS type A sorting domain-containing protein [Bacteroidia bacterium]|nr:T9SS type A sorting domain-containing protein [Bacteroidia bacterium]
MIKSLRFLLPFFATFIFLNCNLKAQEWTWIKGANTINSYGVYGTQGTAASSNLAGSREGAATWTDGSGNLWMFGGTGFCSFTSGRLNDLWKLDPTTHNWTWMGGLNSVNQIGVFGTQGSASTLNIPSSRAYPGTWIDNSGNLWLFGGYGLDNVGNTGNLSDLWKYNPSTSEWTWVSGSNSISQYGVYGTQGIGSSTNTPGARRHSITWKDNSGNFWLFGGFGLDAFGNEAYLNDLWKYDISGGTWTWISGSSVANQYGVYGTVSVASTTNTPGGRYGAMNWKDSGGNFWLFGGSGYANTSTGELNDVWKFNPSTSQWTWVRGSNQANATSVLGTVTIPSSTNTPGGRRFSAVWSDNSDIVYFQGGYGYSTNAYAAQLNDVWKYSMSTNQWAYIRGSQNEVAGTFGTQSVTATSNDPGSGQVRSYWRDNSGNFWLFGGIAYDYLANFGWIGDLWKMNPCPAPAPVNISAFASQNPCTGSSATLTALSNTNTVTWYSTPTGTASLGTGTSYVTTALTSGTASSASFTYYASATNTCGVSLVRTPVVVTSNSIYPTVTTGSVYTATVAIPNGNTPNSDWSPWITYFTDPVPTGGIVIGMDLTCDVVDQGWGGTGAPASMYVSDQFVGAPILQHWWTNQTVSKTDPFSNYVYGGTNSFKMYFMGWSGWQGFMSNAILTIRYQVKPSLPLVTCGNVDYTLKAYGANTYSWTGGITDGVAFTPTVTQTYTVTGYNQYGCPNSAVQQLSVMPTPVISLPSNTTQCPGQSVTQTATITGTAHTFSWNTGATTSSISITPTIGTKYTATAINTITGCFHVLSRKINVSPVPVATVSASSNTICAGISTSLAVTTNAAAYALNFDGIDDYVETNASIVELGQSDFSIEAWIKTTGYSEAIVVCEDSNASWDSGEKAFYLDGSGVPNFVGWGCNYIRGNVSVNDGLWHHVAVTWDFLSGTSGVGKIYVDGVDHTGYVDYVALTLNVGTFKIGSANYNGYTPEAPNNFSGLIDDVRIWNVARSVAQVSGNMSACLSGSESGLVAYYNFEDGPGSNYVSDRSTNDYNGTLTNMAASSAWLTGNSNCSVGYSSYSWLPGGATSQSLSVAPASTTIYSVNITNNLSCTGTSTVLINVNPQPTVSANSGAICAGSTYTIVPSGAATYTFLNGSGVVSPGTTTSYSITGTSSLGCVSAAPGIALVTVNPLPVLSISGPSAMCSSASITQTVSGADTYLWNSGSTSSVVVISPTTNTSYTVSGTNTITGCSNTAVKLITLNYPPVINVNSGNVCSGKVFTIIPSGAATYTFSDGSSIVSSTVMPSSNTSYFVSGTSSAGCVSTSSAVCNVVVNPSPIIIPNSGGVCTGSSYTLSPSGASTYTFYNSSGTISPIVSPGSNTTYSIMGTNILGCVSNSPGIASITVNPLPVIGVSNSTVCLGSSFTIVPTGASTYTFSSGNIVTPTANTNYSVTGTSSAGCVSASAAVITVSTVALPTISVSGGTVCAGSAFTLSPSGAANYTYSSGSAVVIPLSNSNYSITGRGANGCVSSNTAVASVTVVAVPFVTVNSGTICAGQVFTMIPNGASTYSYSNLTATASPFTSTSYSVVGYSTQGCVSSNTAVSTVVVKPIPYLSTFGNVNICSGSSTSLIAFGASTYTWNSSLFGDIQNLSPTQTTNYTVQGTGVNGCTNSVVVTITVNSLPVVTVNSGTVCPASNFTLVPSGALSYSYSGGSDIVTPLITTSYSVMGVDSNGCVSQVPAVATITVINNISVSVSGQTATCLGGILSLNATGAPNYTWSTGDNGAALAITPTVSATYSVIGANGTCRDTVYIPILVYQLPVISTSQSSSLICAGESATISLTGTDSYSWSTGEASGSITVSPLQNSTYTVTATDVNNCTNSSVVLINVNECTGVNGQFSEGILKVYPNPNVGSFYVESDLPCQARLLNILGEEIMTLDFQKGKNEVLMNEQAKGLYFIEITQNNSTSTTRIIKQ